MKAELKRNKRQADRDQATSEPNKGNEKECQAHTGWYHSFLHLKLEYRCFRRLLVSAIQQSESATHVCVQSLSHVWLCATPQTVAHQVPLSVGFSRQEYWSGLSSPTPWDLPHPGTDPASLAPYTYIPPLFWISFPFRSSQSTEFPVLHNRFSTSYRFYT